MKTLNDISEQLQTGNSDEVIRLIGKALAEKITPAIILNNGLIQGMDIIGKKFKAGEIFIPNVLIAARAMNGGIEILEPHLAAAGVEPKGKLLIGTVHGDLHNIGKTLVNIMFKGAGFKIIDLGVNVPAEKFLEAAKQEKPDVIGLSALLTTTMLNMNTTVSLLRENGINIPIIIGGAPTSAQYADSIKADFWAQTASDGVEMVRDYLATT